MPRWIRQCAYTGIVGIGATFVVWTMELHIQMPDEGGHCECMQNERLADGSGMSQSVNFQPDAEFE